MPVVLSACLLALLSCCGRSSTPASPCPADGRLVAIFIEDDPTERPERVEGELVGWSDGWASLRKGDLVIHVPVARIYAIHESKK